MVIIINYWRDTINRLLECNDFHELIRFCAIISTYVYLTMAILFSGLLALGDPRCAGVDDSDSVNARPTARAARPAANGANG
jgi:hypothetical protein